jgi:hypothetical protein
MTSRGAVITLGLLMGLTSGCSTDSNIDQLQSLLIENSDGDSCTVSAEITYNDQRALITALHCVGQNDYVDAPALSTRLPVVERFEAYDIVLLEPSDAIRLPHYAASVFPAVGEEVCKVGVNVKVDCGLIVGPGQVDGTVVTMIDACSTPGDSGSGITWNGSLIGVEGGDVSYAPGFNENLPCNFVEQSRMNPLYSLGLPSEIIRSVR